LQTVDALAANDLARVGQLMNASHTSLADDYEVSSPALDAMVAAMRGARSLSTDWYPAAVEFSEWNARNLGLDMEACMVDWRDPPSAVLDLAPFDLVVGADILYEARNGVALGMLIPALCGPSTEVIIADPRRPDARGFVEAMQSAGWSYRREDIPVPGRIDETGPIVHVHRFTPPPSKHNEPVVL
jgi:hypothetical protein